MITEAPPPTVIDGEAVVTSGNIRNPHLVGQGASAVILLGTAAAFLVNLDGTPAGKDVNAALLAVTFLVHVFYLIRAHAWADC